MGTTKGLIEKLGINPVNIWDSTTAKWSQERKKWKDLIETAGELAGVENPNYATRENCWQVNGGISKYFGNPLNGGASVLDPFVCELIIKLFMPKRGTSIYSPLLGDVQMGFVAGFMGYEYVGTEIRKNQCDANTKICDAFEMYSVKWVNADSTTYFDRNKKFDMVFTCPPYYGVEEYLDYGGVRPENELNNLSDYSSYREMLFKSFDNSIEMLNDNSFIVIMIGDSRNPKTGGYYGTEADTETYLIDKGLLLYNRIVYLEAQFTRSMMTKKTIQSRKLPKCEQKIIVGFKGNQKNIPPLFENM